MNLFKEAKKIQEKSKKNSKQILNQKSRKMVPEPSKIEARGLQNWARKPPRHHFYKTSNLRSPKIAPKCPKSRQEAPKGLPNPPKIKEKSIPKGLQKQYDFQEPFFNDFFKFSTSKSINFCIHFGAPCKLLLELRILKKPQFSLGKTMIFKVSSLKKTPKNHPKKL